VNKGNVLLLMSLFFYLEINAGVTLTESRIQWKTFNHTVNSDNSLQNDTFSTDIVIHTYSTLVMENEYLKVTLVPDFGGRILSMIYKPTGHEQLYQNPVGRPYGSQWDVFYYDWLMLWGGIFPTFPEPEHGKAWCLPWEYEITGNTAEEVSVKMSFTDDINFNTPATKMKYGTTSITCHFEVTLAAGSSALKTSVTLVNPNGSEIPCEYWTNVGVAPGSVPGSTQCDDQTEIVGPVSNVKIYNDWPAIQNIEQNVNGNIYQFKNLRWYKSWADDGIAYAWPIEGNFWGAINHGNNEAILRISANEKTPGLKLWGFGYNQSRGFNPETNIDYHRPFIEMWAGVSKEFFTPAQFPANSSLQFDEYYTPVVGLESFTHASECAVIDLTTDKESYDGNSDPDVVVSCRYFVTKPADQVTVLLQFRGGDNTVTAYDTTGVHDTNGPFDIEETVALQDLCDEIDRLVFELRSDDQTLMNAEVPLTVSNAGTCATSLKQGIHRLRTIRSRTDALVFRKFYTLTGAYIGEVCKHCVYPSSKNGVFLSVDNQGKCTRHVGLHR
jgi:hypothetical protein